MLTPIWLKVSPPRQTFLSGSELKVLMEHFAYILSSSSIEESLSWCNKGQTNPPLTFLQIFKCCFDISAILFNQYSLVESLKIYIAILPLSLV